MDTQHQPPVFIERMQLDPGHREPHKYVLFRTEGRIICTRNADPVQDDIAAYDTREEAEQAVQDFISGKLVVYYWSFKDSRRMPVPVA